MPKVYQLQMPAGVQAGSRAANYVSAYQKGRYELWKIALADAKRELELDQADYEARRKVATELRDTLREEISATQKAIDALRTDEISRRQGIEQRNTNAINATDRYNVGQQNSWWLSTAPTYTSSSRTYTGGTPGTPAPAATMLPLPDAEQERAAQAAIHDNVDALSSDISSSVLVSHPRTTLAEIEAAIVEGQHRFDEALGTQQTGLPSFQGNVGRYQVADDIIESAASSTGATPDAIRTALRLHGSSTFVADYEDWIKAIHEISPISTPSSRSASRPYTTTGSSRKQLPAGGPAQAGLRREVQVDDGGMRADLNARLQRLNSELLAIDLPELERRNLLDLARKAYVRDFGYDWRRNPRAAQEPRETPAYTEADVESLRQLLERDGVEAVRERFAAAGPAAPVPAAVPDAEPPAVPAAVPDAVPGNATDIEAVEAPRPDYPADEDEVTKPRIAPGGGGGGGSTIPVEATATPTQLDAAARVRALVAGKELSDDAQAFDAMMGTEMGRLVAELWSSTSGVEVDAAGMAELEDQLIGAYEGEEVQADALRMLHAVRVRSIERMMATG